LSKNLGYVGYICVVLTATVSRVMSAYHYIETNRGFIIQPLILNVK